MIAAIIKIRANHDVNGNSRRMYLVVECDFNKGSNCVTQVRDHGEGLRGSIKSTMGIDIATLSHIPAEISMKVSPAEFKRIVKEGAFE